MKTTQTTIMKEEDKQNQIYLTNYFGIDDLTSINRITYSSRTTICPECRRRIPARYLKLLRHQPFNWSGSYRYLCLECGYRMVLNEIIYLEDKWERLLKKLKQFRKMRDRIFKLLNTEKYKNLYNKLNVIEGI